MKSELIDVSGVHKEIKIEIEAAEIKPVYDSVVGRFSKLATVPGFRKGYAPVAVVKNRYKDDIQNDVLRDLLPPRVTAAIQEFNLNPLSEPQLHIENAENLNLTSGESLGIHVHVEVMPTIDEVNYKSLEVVRRVRPVDETEIERIIEDRRREGAGLIAVEDRAAEIGDTVIVDIHGTFADEDNDPIQVEDLEIELGGENVQQEFTDNLTGANVDDVKEFQLIYPEDFTSPGLAGKTVNYAATVKSIGRVELPELNDEWAQSLSEEETSYETLADVRAELRKNLENFADTEADNRVRDELMNLMIDANNVDVPPTLTNYQAQGLTRQFAENMERQGVDMRNADEKLLQMLYQKMLPQAEREVRGALLLDRISQFENVEVSEDEVTAELELIGRYSNRTLEQVREMIAAQENGDASVRERLVNRKAVEILVSNAVITEGEWIEPQPPELPETTEEIAVEAENEGEPETRTE